MAAFNTNRSPEHRHGADSHDTDVEPMPEAVNQPSSPEKADADFNLEAIREEIDREAIGDYEKTISHEQSLTSQEKQATADTITNFDKQRAYAFTLTRIQGQLPTISRAFSGFIHSKPVETVSSVLEASVARPSGILGAGITASLFLAVMLFFARRNGFALSGSELIVAVVVGWLLGVVSELITRMISRRRT